MANRVNAEFLGCGGFMGCHAERLRGKANVWITALCDVNEDHIRKWMKDKLPGYKPAPAVFTNPAQMYAETSPAESK